MRVEGPLLFFEPAKRRIPQAHVGGVEAPECLLHVELGDRGVDCHPQPDLSVAAVRQLGPIAANLTVQRRTHDRRRCLNRRVAASARDVEELKISQDPVIAVLLVGGGTGGWLVAECDITPVREPYFGISIHEMRCAHQRARCQQIVGREDHAIIAGHVIQRFVVGGDVTAIDVVTPVFDARIPRRQAPADFGRTVRR